MGEDAKSAPTVAAKPKSRPRSEPRAADAPPDPPTGERYELGSEIARGGMGRVVEATDTLLGRTVALKEALASDGEALRRFHRETRITARLEHPSIVPVHDAGTTPDGSPFYVMRKVSGRPLEKLVAEADTLAKRLTLLPHIVAAAQAIAHAHRRGVVHRDLKPSNILVGDLGETVVIDWGLAKVMDEPDDDDPHAPPRIDAGSSLQTRVGTVFGTPGFMPAEQLRGEPVDERSDVYALGATLYFVLARTAPHGTTSEDEMMQAAAAGPPTPIAELVPGVPAELATIVDKALAFDPRRRYVDAAALAEELQRFLAGQLVASHRYSRRDRLVRFVRKQRVPVAIASIAVIALAVGAWIAIARVLTERDRADAQAHLATAREHEAEAARLREEERGDQLLLDHARELVATNPTASVALLKQLTSSPKRWERYWQQARAIASASRVAGVAWAAPGPGPIGSLVISPGGTLALVSGDKTLRLYDLEHRTTTDVATFPDNRSAKFADDAHVVANGNKAISIIDLRTKAQREITPAAPPLFVEATPTIVFWTDPEALWFAPLDGSAPPRRIATPTRPQLIELSPDRRWLAFTTETSLAVLAAEAPAQAPRVLVPEAPRSPLAWNASSTEIAAAYRGRVASIPIDGRPIQWHPFDAGWSVVGSSRNRLMASDRDGHLTVFDGATARTLTGDRIELGIGLHSTYDDRLAYAHGSVISVARGTFAFDLFPPTDHVNTLATRLGSPFVLAGSGDKIFVFDLRQIIPPFTVQLEQAVSTQFVSTHDILSTTTNLAWQWFDVDRQKVACTIEGVPPIVVVESRPGNDLAIAIDVTQERRTSYLFHKGSSSVEVLDDNSAISMLEHSGKIILGTAAGNVVEYDPVTKARRTVIERPGALASIAYEGHWFVAAYMDNHLVWHDETTGEQKELSLPHTDDEPAYALRLEASGRVCLPRGRKLSCFAPGGPVTSEVELPDRITSSAGVGDMLLLGQPDGSKYLVDPRTGTKRGMMIAGTRSPSNAAMKPLGVYVSGRGSIEMVDFAVGEHWPLTRDLRPWLEAKISADASFVLVTAEDNIPLVWKIDLPSSSSEVAAWLGRQTNATAELGTTTLTWH